MKKMTNLFHGILTGSFLAMFIFFTGCDKKEQDKSVSEDLTAPVILSTTPLNNTTAATNIVLSISFSEEINPVSVTTSSFGLKQGSNTITGSLSYSGTTVTFSPAVALEPNKVYTATATTAIEDIAGNPIVSNYTWSFTTVASTADITAPTVSSVSPIVNATSVPLTSKPTVTFSEPVNSSTVTSSSFLLKQGTTVITGTSSVSGSMVTLTPTSALAANKVYTVLITTAIKDIAGNSLASNYSWNFTTGTTVDLVPPAVILVSPAVNATSVEVNSKPLVTFSESVNPATVTSSSFILKQGSSIIPGNVSVSGAVATFSPASALTAGSVYSATVTTGVKDEAGNSLTSNYSWSFTTASPVVLAKSFSADVVPVLNLCNTCHTHGWTPSGTASTFHANLLSKGYISTTSPTSGKIYQKVSGGHPSSTVSAQQKSTLLTWITEGSKNN